MVKNVRNKIIISVASILLMAAAIVAYPYIEDMAKAAATYVNTTTYSIPGKYKDSSITYTVQFEDLDIAYDGTPKTPTIYQVKAEGGIIPGGSKSWGTADAQRMFVVEIAGSHTNANTGGSKYDCNVRINPAAEEFDWSIDAGSEVPFTISKANVDITSVDIDKQLLLGTSGSVAPVVNDVVITFDNGTTKHLQSGEYTVSPATFTTAGRYTVEIDVSANDNYQARETKQITEIYVANDLSDLNPSSYKVDFENAVGTWGATWDAVNNRYYVDYDTNGYKPKLKLFDGSSTLIASQNDLETTYWINGTKTDSIKAVGEYTIKLAPKNGKRATVGSAYFANEFTKTIEVKGLDAQTDLVVYYDMNSDGYIDPSTEVVSDRSVILNYNNGERVEFKPVEPKGKVYSTKLGRDLLESEYECRCTGAAVTSTGTAQLEIIPRGTEIVSVLGSTTKRILYVVASELDFKPGYSYIGSGPVGSATDKLVFNGRVRYVNTYSVAPVGGGDDLDSSQYKVYYQYFNASANKWLPEDNGGYGWTEAQIISAYNTPNSYKDIADAMASSGSKRAVIVGQAGGDFRGQVGMHVYEITKVDMSDSSADGKFDVTITSPSAMVYDGNPKTPELKIVFTPKKVNPSDPAPTPYTLVKDVDYTISYSNNVNATTADKPAVATIKGTPNGTFDGELIKEFEIQPFKGQLRFLAPDNTLLVSNELTYNGSIQTPIFAIYDDTSKKIFKLESSDYSVTDSSGQPLTSENVGTYTYNLVLKNSNLAYSTYWTSYKIIPAALKAEMFTVENEVWDGTKMPARVSSPKLVEGVDYTVGTPSNSDKPGTATVRITGTGNYTNHVDINYTISPRPIDSEGITATVSVGTHTVSGYPVTITVKDAATASKTVTDADYDVNVYKTTKAGRTLVSTEATGNFYLTDASEYEFEIVGKNKYTGTLTSEDLKASCGINLADYYLYINDGNQRRHEYTGADIAPTSIVLKKIGVSGDVAGVKYNVEYKRTNSAMSGDIRNVGRVYIYGTGDEANGTYGETTIIKNDDPEHTDVLGTYFDIVPASWDRRSNYLMINVVYDPDDSTKTDMVYYPLNNANNVPQIEVYYDRSGSGKKDATTRLDIDTDYKIYYPEKETYDRTEAASELLKRGKHPFTVIGINNYADLQHYNNITDYIQVNPAEITRSWVVPETSVDFITERYPFSVLYGGTSPELVPGVDYKVTSVDFIDAGDSNKLKRKYTISGITGSKPNYIVNNSGNDTITFDMLIAQTDLSTMKVYENKDDCAPGDLYIVWTKTTQVISDHDVTPASRIQTKPKFTLYYVKEDGTLQRLWEYVAGDPQSKPESECSFKVESTGYGANNMVGTEGNHVTITGINGFRNSQDIPCTLYYPLNSDSNTISFTGAGDGSESLLPNEPVKLSSLKEWVASGTVADHIHMVYNDGTIPTTGGISMVPETDFTAVVTDDLNKIGTKHIEITGTETADNYFRGNFVISVYATGDLDDASITIGSYGNNEIEYDGQTLTAAKMNLQVVVNKTILHENTDYKVESIVQPTNIGPGTITLSGLGEYKGTTVSADFKVVANLGKNPYLKYELLGSDDAYYEYDAITRDNKTYPYKQEVKPEVKVSIQAKDTPGTYLPISQNIPAEGESVAAGMGYYLTYVGNTRATDNESAFIHINPSTDSYLRYSKQMSFVIARTDINSPAVSEIGPTNTTPMYTGSPMDPDIDLNFKLTDAANPGVDLVNGVDYELNYNPGINYTDYTNQTVELIVSGKGNYKGTKLVRYAIQQRPMTAEYYVMAQPVEMPYRNAQITADIVGPKIQVVQNGDNILHKKLRYGIDFEIAEFRNLSGSVIDAPKAVGSYKIVLKAKDGSNYKDTQVIDYRITELELTEIDITLSNCDCTANDGNTVLHCIYNGKEHRPAVEVKYQGNAIDSSDYEVTYTNNINAGTATVTVTPNSSGSSNFSGTKSVDFTIYPKSISELVFAPVDAPNHKLEANGIDITPAYDFTGHTVQPGMNVFDEEIKTPANAPTELINSSDGSKDYRLTYETTNQRIEIADGVETCSYAGKLRVIVEGTGNYTGTKTFNYYIGRNIDQAYPVIQIPLVTYNGLKQAPIITNVERNGVSLIDDEYTVVAYKRVENVINKDEPLDYNELTDAAEYVIAVEGVPSKGTYTKNPRQDTTYRILPRSISGAEVSGFEGMYYYTGSDICPRGIIVTDTSLPISLTNLNQTKSVQLISGTDYTVTYKNNRAAGKATIVVEGKGNYSGYVYAYFTIDSSNISGGDGYDETSDGTGALDGGGYSISPSDITFTYSTSGNNWMDYTGYSVRPSFTITQNGAAVPSSYFYVTLENSVNPGVATMVIHGDGVNLTGAISKNYLIKADLARYGKIAPIEDQIYTGNQITPAVTVSVGNVVLREGVDYNVTYVNNTNMGTATAYATATVANSTFYYGRLTGTFNISNAAGGMQVVGYASTYSYTGSPITPDIAVTMNGVNLVKDRDYTVTYRNNTNVGTATITVQGKGSYSGTKNITFVIQPKNIENCVASVVQNQSYTGQTYTPVISITDMGTGKTLVSGSDYTLTYSNNTNPGTATITVQALGQNYTGSKVVNFKITSAPVTGLKLVSATNHKVKMSWNKQDYADGYQICNASNRVLGATKSNSITVSGLSSAKTYSFKVRSYVQNADGSVSYGDFSSIVSTKTMLNTPAIKVDARGNGIVTVRWSKVEKATGYEIYYSTTKSGTYYKLATASKSAKRIFNDKGLAKGEVYYYTMRAYRTVNGEKVYSGYSTIKKVKVK